MLSFFPRDVLDGLLGLIGSGFKGFPTYFIIAKTRKVNISVNIYDRAIILHFCTSSNNPLSIVGRKNPQELTQCIKVYLIPFYTFRDKLQTC